MILAWLANLYANIAHLSVSWLAVKYLLTLTKRLLELLLGLAILLLLVLLRVTCLLRSILRLLSVGSLLTLSKRLLLWRLDWLLRDRSWL